MKFLAIKYDPLCSTLFANSEIELSFWKDNIYSIEKTCRSKKILQCILQYSLVNSVNLREFYREENHLFYRLNAIIFDIKYYKNFIICTYKIIIHMNKQRRVSGIRLKYLMRYKNMNHTCVCVYVR